LGVGVLFEKNASGPFRKAAKLLDVGDRGAWPLVGVETLPERTP
jgi:hypothetical protein